LVSVRGKYEAGAVSLADDEVVRMEVQWRQAREALSPEDAVGSHVAGLRKDARKKGLECTVQRDLGLASPPGRESEVYRWVSGQQILAMLSYCPSCRRTVHVKLMGRPDEQLNSLGRTIFASMREHGDGLTRPWDFFDVHFRSPVGVPLVKSSLKTGCIRMDFARRWLRLSFVRLSLAQMLLAGKGLERWLCGYWQRELKRRSCRAEPVRIKGHEGVALSGRPWLLVNPTRLIGRGRIVRVGAWHCDETNRLFICAYDGPQAESDVFQAALKSVECCRAADG
jgi:hypothetical protein